MNAAAAAFIWPSFSAVESLTFEQQGNSERGLGVFKECYLLFNTIFKEVKLILFQVGNRSAISIHHAHRNSNQRGAECELRPPDLPLLFSELVVCA